MSNRQPCSALQQPSRSRRSANIAPASAGDSKNRRQMPHWRLVVCVLLPFAAAYYISYVFWLISPLISTSLAKDLNLSSSELGVLASSYILALTVAQLPLGVLIDRYGPRLVQSVCLMIAAAGAVIFALGDTLAVLVLGRIMIGFGVATILITGLKSIATWFPPNDVATASGLLVSLGAFGAITATEPAGQFIDVFGWRLVCLGLAAAAAICALVIFAIVPEPKRSPPRRQDTTTLVDIYKHRRFWTLAPLSAACVGTAWAMQGLWAANWLSEVESFDRQTVIRHLLVMAMALGVGALLLGSLSERLRKLDIAPEALFGCLALISILSELSILLHLQISSYLCWAVVALMGASSVLSHSMVVSYFPKEASGRANTALHLLHLGVAFIVQWATGAIVDLWQFRNAAHPAQAFQAAFAIDIAMQAAALIWFVRPAAERLSFGAKPVPTSALLQSTIRPQPPSTPYTDARREWIFQLAAARAHRDSWWLAALGSSSILVALMGLVASGH